LLTNYDFLLHKLKEPYQRSIALQENMYSRYLFWCNWSGIWNLSL